MSMQNHVPFSRQALQNLSVALGVNSAYLWVEPETQALGLKKLVGEHPAAEAEIVELHEEEA